MDPGMVPRLFQARLVVVVGVVQHRQQLAGDLRKLVGDIALESLELGLGDRDRGRAHLEQVHALAFRVRPDPLDLAQDRLHLLVFPTRGGAQPDRYVGPPNGLVVALLALAHDRLARQASRFELLALGLRRSAGEVGHDRVELGVHVRALRLPRVEVAVERFRPGWPGQSKALRARLLLRRRREGSHSPSEQDQALLGATAIGGSDTDILRGALTGGAGSLYGSAQEAMGDVPAAKPSAPKALPAGEPGPAPGSGTTTSPAPTSGEEPTATPAGGSSPVATGEELAVSVAKQQGHEDEMYGPRRVEEELETDFGMPVENQHKIQQAADLTGVIVEIRPTNPASVARLRQGNLPKPMDIKGNTVNELDVHLGARPEDIGLVASFLPNEPVRTPAMSDETWAKVQARYADRSQSYDEQAYTLHELSKPVAEQNPAITHQKIQIRIDEHGVVRTSVPVRGVPVRSGSPAITTCSSSAIPTPARRSPTRTTSPT